MKYDKQVILVMLTAPMNNLKTFGMNLFNKNPVNSILVEYNVELQVFNVVRGDANRFPLLTENSRVQIVGHGDLNGVSCCKRNAEEMAKFIYTKLFPGLMKIKRISLIVCYGAGNLARELEGAANLYTSFAAQLIWCLKFKYQFITDVSARAATIIVNEKGHKLTRFAYSTFGEPYIHHGENTKYLYKWVGDEINIFNLNNASENMDIG